MPTIRLAALARWWCGLPPRAGATTVLAVEGCSGSGKTTLAAALAPLVPDAQTVAMDELIPGWDGLTDGIRLLVEHVLAPMASGRPASVPRWDWTAGAPAAARPLPATRRLLVEGVGSGALACAPYLSGLVVITTPEDVRRPRALARDGAGYAPNWTRWADQEVAYLRADRPDARADLVLDGTRVAAGESGRLDVLVDRRG